MRSQAKPSILQVAPCYVDLEKETGGVANIIRQICTRLADNDWRVVLLCTNEELGNTVAEPGIYHPHENIEMRVVQQRSIPVLYSFEEIAKTAHEPHLDIAHVHTCFSALTEKAMDVLKNINIPYVFTPHGKLSPNMYRNHRYAKRLWWELWGRNAVHNAERIALSDAGESKLFDKLGLPDSWVVIPNGFQVPENFYLQESREDRLARSLFDMPYVLFLGYLDPRKQPELLVEAFARTRIRETHRLVIVGPDSYGHKPIIEQAIYQNSLMDRVDLYGAAYGTEKWRLLSGASCLALPSKGEGSPVTAFEALGAGTPLIVSAQSNVPSTLEGAACVLHSFEPEAWAEALDNIVLNAERNKKMSETAHKLASKFAWTQVVHQWDNLYQSILN